MKIMANTEPFNHSFNCDLGVKYTQAIIDIKTMVSCFLSVNGAVTRIYTVDWLSRIDFVVLSEIAGGSIPG